MDAMMREVSAARNRLLRHSEGSERLSTGGRSRQNAPPLIAPAAAPATAQADRPAQQQVHPGFEMQAQIPPPDAAML